MTVINGFIIVLMLLLLFYTLYRLFKKKSLLMVIPVCAQIFSLSLAILSFVNNVEVLQYVELAYLLFGILPPVGLLFLDYISMTKKIKTKVIFQGLIEKPQEYISVKESLLPEGINPIIKEKQVQEVMKSLDKLPEEIQKNFRKCLNHANVLLTEGNTIGAYFIYDTLSKAAGSSYILFYNLGGLCYSMKRYDEALEAYKKSLELFAGEPLSQQDIYYNMGNTCFLLNRFEKAARNFEKTLEINPNHKQAVENLAFTYVYIGDIDKGIETLRKTANDGDNYRSHYISGKLLYEAGKLEDAEAELRNAVKLQPDSIEVLHELGRLLMKLKKSDAAIEVFKEINRINPDDYLAWSGEANAYSRLKRWKEAVEAYKEAIRVKPDSSVSYYNMAMALEECNNRKLAAEAYYKAIELNPDLMDGYNNLGIVLSVLGRREEALEVYEEGIKRKPKEASLYFNMGMCLYEEGRYSEAVAVFRNALDISPEELEIYYYLGAALTEMRHYNDAIEAYKYVLEYKPSDGELHYNLAAIYAMLGRYDIAGDNLKKAIELDGDIRKDAKENQAFDGMRGRSDFKKMVS